MSHLFHKNTQYSTSTNPVKITCGLLLTTVINLNNYRSTLLVGSHFQKWVSLTKDSGFKITKVIP